MARTLTRPVLVLVMGLPGAGKSTLARALCRRLDCERVDRDAIRFAMFPRGRASAAEKTAANAAVWRATGLWLGQGRSVVVDGMTFAGAAQRRRGRALARRLGARCLEILLDCPVALAEARVRRSRRHAAPDRAPRLVREVAARFAPVGARALRVDARAPPRRQLRALAPALAALA